MREKGSADSQGIRGGRGEGSVGGTRAARKAEYISQVGTARINKISETRDRERRVA